MDEVYIKKKRYYITLLTFIIGIFGCNYIIFIDNKFNLKFLYQVIISAVISGAFIIGVFRLQKIIFQVKPAIIFTKVGITLRIGLSSNYLNWTELVSYKIAIEHRKGEVLILQTENNQLKMDLEFLDATTSEIEKLFNKYYVQK